MVFKPCASCARVLAGAQKLGFERLGRDIKTGNIKSSIEVNFASPAVSAFRGTLAGIRVLKWVLKPGKLLPDNINFNI